MADSSPLLDIATLADRPKIRIDGTLYEIVSPDELSIIDCHRLAALGRRLDALMAAAELSTADEAELGQVIGALAGRIMIGVPDEVARRLTDGQRLAVIEGFTGLLPAPPAAEAARQTAGRSTGGRRSPACSASTAASRPPGSRRRRSASSAPCSP